MNFLKFMKKTVLNACFYFTLAEFAVLSFATVFLASESGGSTAVEFLNLGSTALLFLACFILSAFNFIWSLEYSTSVKVLVHFFGMLAAFALIFIVIPRAFDSATHIISLVAMYTGIYLVVAFVVLVVGSIRKIRRSNKLEYKSQFNELNKK